MRSSGNTKRDWSPEPWRFSVIEARIRAALAPRNRRKERPDELRPTTRIPLDRAISGERVTQKRTWRSGPVRARRLRLTLLAVVALGATGLAIVAYETELLHSLELSTVDTRFAIRGHQRPPSN